MSDIKPIVLISKCLEHEPCRYNGDVIRHSFIKAFQKFVEFKPICPEVEMGLGIPRDPLRVVLVDGVEELYQPLSEKMLTKEMDEFCKSFFSKEETFDGFILKNRSPSCGISDVKIFQGLSKSAASKKGKGLFGGLIVQRFDGYPIEDEGRLNNIYLREHFLTALYAIARFRQIKESLQHKDLLKFQQNHKLLFMAYNQTAAKRLGRICANKDQLGMKALFESYFNELKLIFNKPPKFSSMINALMHAFGGISKGLSPAERKHFLNSIEEYRDERIPLSTLIYLLQTWAIRFENQYLQDQALLSPFPAKLIDLTNTAKKRF